MRGLTEVTSIVGQTVAALAHDASSEDIGSMNVDVLMKDGGNIYRFATEELLGESTLEGWQCEHYSLTVERVDAVSPGSQVTDLTGVVIDAEVVVCDEWLGPVDETLPALGTRPRTLFDGKVGSCTPGARPTTVVCGVVLRSADWSLMIRTDAFPLHVNFSTDALTIESFVERFS